MSKTTKIILIILIIVLVAGGIWYYIRWQQTPGKYDDFAKCLKEKGVVFYGAFWCSHCQSQKKAFGKSAKYLPYVECSTPNGQGQTFECQQKKIDGYPTWVFPDGTPDGSRESGELAFETLAEKTGCQLPEVN